MSLVGDIIMELRARIPDAPSVHNPPIFISAVGTNQPGGQFQPGTTHTLAATGVTNWGETAASNQLTVILGASDNAVVAVVAMSGIQIQTINIYEAGQGTPLTATADMWSFPAAQFPAGQGSYFVGVGTPLMHTTLPTRSTAFLPDTDGNFIGSYTAYRLLNRALQEMVRIAGGIIDVTGVQSHINQSMYRLASPFYTFINAWFDGYPMDIVPRNFMYLRNSAAGFSGILSYEQDGPQSVIQVWPQSNRTGGENQLAGNIEADTPFFQCFAGASNFLSIGLAQIDDEMVVYSSVTTLNLGAPPFDKILQFNGVTRGMGGTTAVTHAEGAPVTELNIRLSGYRMAETYEVGDSNQTIMVPQAWETPLVLHMLSQVRSMEQDEATSKQLLGDFVQMADKIAKQSRLGKIKPRQIPVWGQNTSDARNVNGIGFGWLIN